MKTACVAAAMLWLAVVASAAVDPNSWRDWKRQDGYFERDFVESLHGEARAEGDKFLLGVDDLALSVEDKVRTEARAERVAIAESLAKGEIDADFAAAEKARLDKAANIHLCYVYGSILPRIYAEGLKDNPQLDRFRDRIAEKITRAEYESMLKADPLQKLWAGTSGNPSSLSHPMPAADDGR